ncbi:MAG: hypothetical protein GY861_10985 [bacterium]|nr:hypothetical protein [bacterium]
MTIKKFYKKFTPKKEMVEAVASLTDEFDTEAMVEVLSKTNPRRIYLVTKGGKKIACDNFKKFISILTTQGGLDFLYPICFGRGETYHLYSKTDYFNTVSQEKVVEPAVKEEKVEDVVVAEEEVTASPTSKVDWGALEDIYDEDDVRGSKDALEKKVKEDFGIDLRKNQKFEKMLEELRVALGE